MKHTYYLLIITVTLHIFNPIFTAEQKTAAAHSPQESYKAPLIEVIFYKEPVRKLKTVASFPGITNIDTVIMHLLLDKSIDPSKEGIQVCTGFSTQKVADFLNNTWAPQLLLPAGKCLHDLPGSAHNKVYFTTQQLKPVWFCRLEHHQPPSRDSELFSCENANYSLWFPPHQKTTPHTTLSHLMSLASQRWNLGKTPVKLLPLTDVLHHIKDPDGKKAASHMLLSRIDFDKDFVRHKDVRVAHPHNKFLIVDEEDEKKLTAEKERQKKENAELEEFLTTEESFAPETSFTEHLKIKQRGIM